MLDTDRKLVHLELAIVHETLADDSRVNPEIEAALKVDPDLAPAHAVLRRRSHHRSKLASMLQHLERGLAGFLVAEGDANPAVFQGATEAAMSGH